MKLKHMHSLLTLRNSSFEPQWAALLGHPGGMSVQVGTAKPHPRPAHNRVTVSSALARVEGEDFPLFRTLAHPVLIDFNLMLIIIKLLNMKLDFITDLKFFSLIFRGLSFFA